MFVVTLDQRRSRASNDDLVPEWEALLNERTRDWRMLPFERTVGDELQGVVASAEAVVAVVREAARTGEWYVGVGGGTDVSLGRTSRESRGAVFRYAREAVEQAKSQPVPVAVRTANPQQAHLAEIALATFYTLLSERTSRAWEVADAYEHGMTQTAVAAKLGVTRQAISKIAGRGNLAVTRDMATLAAHVLAQAAT